MAILTAAIRNLITKLEHHADGAHVERVDNLLNGLYEQLYRAMNQDITDIPAAMQEYAEEQVQHLEAAMEKASGLLNHLQRG